MEFENCLDLRIETWLCVQQKFTYEKCHEQLSKAILCQVHTTVSELNKDRHETKKQFPDHLYNYEPNQFYDIFLNQAHIENERIQSKK